MTFNPTFAFAAIAGFAVVSACATTAPRSDPDSVAMPSTDMPSGDMPASNDPFRAGPQSIMIEDEHPFDLSADDMQIDDDLALFADDSDASRSLVFGLLHAHTMISDGSGTPAEAFEAAKDRGLDFFAVTPHNHASAEGLAGPRRDSLLIATNPALYSSPTPVTVTRQWTDANGHAQSQTITLESLQSASRSAAAPGFIPLYGQEFSTISSGNHVNIFGVDDVIDVDNGDFAALFDYLDGLDRDDVFLQMNHPSIAKDLFNKSTSVGEKENDYGYDDFGKDFAALIDRADRYLVVIELLSGPALQNRKYPAPYHYGKNHENDYYYYLVQGFHISPSTGHDNHWLHWGDKTPARMGVYTAPDPEALVRAIRANRTFATEDSDLSVAFSCSGAFMGSVIERPAGEDVACQARVSDPTDPDTVYEAELFYGDIDPQSSGHLQQWTVESGWTEIRGRTGDGSVQFPTYGVSGAPEFFYVRVTQSDGDRAWSAPVWINHPRTYKVED